MQETNENKGVALSATLAMAAVLVDGQDVQTVNARDLHTSLESGHKFTDWIQDRIEQYGFSEGVDFVILLRNSPKQSDDLCSPNPTSKGGEQDLVIPAQNLGAPLAKSGERSAQNIGSTQDPRGGHNKVEYHLTLDMAKELAMVEKNEKGRQVRQYFIACEKALRQQEAKNLAKLKDERDHLDLLVHRKDKWDEEANQALNSELPMRLMEIKELKAEIYDLQKITGPKAAQIEDKADDLFQKWTRQSNKIQQGRLERIEVELRRLQKLNDRRLKDEELKLLILAALHEAGSTE